MCSQAACIGRTFAEAMRLRAMLPLASTRKMTSAPAFLASRLLQAMTNISRGHAAAFGGKLAVLRCTHRLSCSHPSQSQTGWQQPAMMACQATDQILGEQGGAPAHV